MKARGIAGVLFDLDGVIVDTAGHHFGAWRDLAEELGISLVPEDEESLKGVSRVDSLEWILAKGGLVLDSNTKRALMDRKNARYLELIEGLGTADILPGAEAFILASKAHGWRVGLGSSSKNAVKILNAIGLSHHFEAIIDGNRITLSKPDPEVFLLGAQALGLDPHCCLVVEDASSGVAAGKAGGFPVLGVGDPDVLKGADFVVSDLLDCTPQDIENRLGRS